MNTPNIFARLTKVDEEKRLVFGRIAEEAVDKSGEIMDYEKSKPHFQKWSTDVQNDTGGKSLGNVRAMHGKVAAGVLKAIDFDDVSKSIDVAAKIVDDGEWKKVLEGVYSGFSIGGSYLGNKTVEKINGQDVTRYVAKPNEVSIVDRPCLGSAKFFEVQKADGTLSKVDFKPPTDDKDGDEGGEGNTDNDGDEGKTAEELEKEKADKAAQDCDTEKMDGTIEGTPEQVDELTKLMNSNKLNMGDVIKTLSDSISGELVKKTEPELKKSLAFVEKLSSIMVDLYDLTKTVEYEESIEKEAADISKRLNDSFKSLGGVLVDLANANVEGLTENLTIELSEKAGELVKRTGEIEESRKLAKVDNQKEGVDTATLQKAVSEALAPMQKIIDEQKARLEKLEAQPAPARVNLRAVSKTEDNPELNKTKEPELIKDDHGQEHPVASLIKNLHQNGGNPLAYRG